ncbi:MAG: YiiX/YebB-like N1pC/P60 family cysteine hydrolase [Luteolibacter sp.]|uniref:YiiX/YebB-like N1pC/P60 family cysteine hydrolase n=1 Tax=Luteolibacter sp. TaxID=1962973 RepID=UPI003265F12C
MNPLLSAAACAFFSASALLTAGEKAAAVLREGDIVFSSSEQGQGEAIIAATGSPYTHCGILFRVDGKLMVLEAVQPVGVVSLSEFMARSKPGTTQARRLKTPLAAADVERGREWATAQVGKNYDAKFLWDDGQLYCSELVWKIYQHAGIELCKPRQFKDFKLDDPKVKKIIEQRFGSVKALPRDEKVVAPADLASSPLLEEVAGLP